MRPPEKANAPEDEAGALSQHTMMRRCLRIIAHNDQWANS